MQKCPNCGRPTARTEDWACQWCGYPLLSRSYKKIPKTFRELREERQARYVPPVTEEERAPEREVVPPPPPEPRPEPKAVEEAEPPPTEEVKREPVAEVRAEPVKKVKRKPVAETKPEVEIKAGVEPGAPAEVAISEEHLATEAPELEVKSVQAAEDEAGEVAEPEARLTEESTPQAEVKDEAEPVTVPVAEVEPETKEVPEVEPEAEKAPEDELEAEAAPDVETAAREEGDVATEPMQEAGEEIENEPATEKGPVEQANQEPEPEYGTVMESGAIKISVAGVVSAFQANRAEAHQRFDDKVLHVTGVVEKVMVRDALDIFYILLSGNGSNLWHIRCIFDRESGSRLQRLGSGQTVTVQGNYAGYERNILLKDCALVG